MDEQAVKEYVEKAQSLLDDSPQMGEATTKAAILRDFLDLLGWEIPQNTRLEYSVKAFGRTYKVDYALVLEGTPVAFLEAKGADTSLSEKHKEQLKAYLKNEDVNLGILANGQEYQFFRRQVVDSKVLVNSVATAQIQELPEHINILEAYSKAAIENEEWMKILDRINELQNAQLTLEEQKDELATEISGVLSDNVSSAITPIAEIQAKEMIDGVILAIEEEIDPNARGSTEENVAARGTTEVAETSQLRRDAISGSIRRENIVGPDDATVAVFPTKESGLEFLKENNAWGFVTIAQEPEYAAMYVTRNIQQVKYFAKVQEIVPATEADLSRPSEFYYESGSDEAQAGFDPDQQVVVFEEGSLVELEDPIPFESRYPQARRYTTLEQFRDASTTDDIL